MGKSAPRPPTPPDPRELAQADAEFNRINQITPKGNLTFSGPNRNVATQTFSPEIQALFDQGLGISNLLFGQVPGRLGALDQNPIDLSQFGDIQSDAGLQNFNFDQSGLPGIPGNFGEFRNEIEDAFFERSSRLLNPQFEQQEEQLRQTLANQGLFSGDQAATQQFETFGENRNRAFGDIANSAVLFGGQEASRQLADILGTRQQSFNNQFTSNQANNLIGQQNLGNQNAGRVQALNEIMGMRGNQFNEIAALLGLNQIQPQGLNNFFGPGQVDVLGANALNLNQQNQNFQAANNTKSAGLGGLATLGSAGITGGADIKSAGIANPPSDRRLKRNIQRIGSIMGHPWYSFEYLWGEKSQGVMSDEIPQEFVHKGISGFDTVDYQALLSQ
jgi:hypothetical protein